VPYVDVDGVRIAYDRQGEGHPMLMVHGASQDSTSWRFNTGYFAQFCDVIAMDNPGHGKSAMPPGGPLRSIPELAAYAWGVIEALGVENPIVMGHSLGGAIALRLAVEHPDRIGAVVDVDGAARTAAGVTNYRAGVLDLVRINPTDWLETTFLSVLGRTTPMDRKREMASDARRVIPEVALADLYAYTSCNFVDELSTITAPVVAVVGEDDWSCSPELTHETYLAVTAPKSYHMFEGIGHIPHTEQPDEFNAVVHRLLAAHGMLPAV